MTSVTPPPPPPECGATHSDRWPLHLTEGSPIFHTMTASPNQLGFPHNPNYMVSFQQLQSTQTTSPPSPPPAGNSSSQRDSLTDSGPNGSANPNRLGFALQSSVQPGAFPKVSSNFDKPDNCRHVKVPVEKNQPSGKDDGTTDTLQQSVKERPLNHSTSAIVQQTSSNPSVIPSPQQYKQDDVTTGFTRAPKLSFAEAAARRAARPPDLFVHNMFAIKPVRLNDDLAVIMPADMYELQLRSFQYALIGRLTLPPGSAPRGGEELCWENPYLVFGLYSPQF